MQRLLCVAAVVVVVAVVIGHVPAVECGTVGPQMAWEQGWRSVVV